MKLMTKILFQGSNLHPYFINPLLATVKDSIMWLEDLKLESANVKNNKRLQQVGIFTSRDVLIHQAILTYLKSIVDGERPTAASRLVAKYALGADTSGLIKSRALAVRKLAWYYVHDGLIPVSLKGNHVKTKSLLKERA